MRTNMIVLKEDNNPLPFAVAADEDGSAMFQIVARFQTLDDAEVFMSNEEN